MKRFLLSTLTATAAIVAVTAVAQNTTLTLSPMPAPATPAPLGAVTPPAATPAPAATPKPRVIRAAAAVAADSPPGPQLNDRELLRELDNLSHGEPLVTVPPGGPSGTPNEGSGTTEITAREGTFDEKGHVAVFLKEVYVENPDFTVNCDKLTAYLKHEEKVNPDDPDEKVGGKSGAAGAKPGATPKATPKPTPKPGPTPAAKEGASTKGPKISTQSSENASQADRMAVQDAGKAPKPKSSGGLEHAVAEGHVIIIQDKIDPDGSISHNIGHAAKAVYQTDTGDITLMGMPTVEQGINTCIALEESTVMVLNREGHMTVFGGLSKTIVRDSSAASGNSSNSSSSNGH